MLTLFPRIRANPIPPSDPPAAPPAEESGSAAQTEAAVPVDAAPVESAAEATVAAESAPPAEADAPQQEAVPSDPAAILPAPELPPAEIDPASQMDADPSLEAAALLRAVGESQAQLLAELFEVNPTPEASTATGAPAEVSENVPEAVPDEVPEEVSEDVRENAPEEVPDPPAEPVEAAQQTEVVEAPSAPAEIAAESPVASAPADAAIEFPQPEPEPEAPLSEPHNIELLAILEEDAQPALQAAEHVAAVLTDAPLSPPESTASPAAEPASETLPEPQSEPEPAAEPSQADAAPPSAELVAPYPAPMTPELAPPSPSEPVKSAEGKFFVLARVPEPEVMDDSAEVAAYASAAGQAHLDAIDDTFVAHAQLLVRGRERGRALDIGTGPGQIVVKLGQKLTRWKFVGVDRSAAMIAKAQENLAAAPEVAGRVEFLLADGNHLDFPPRSFDLLLCNSVLHHVPDPQQLFSEMARLVKPGGAILLRDLVRPSRFGLKGHLRRHGKHYSGEMLRLYIASVRAAYTEEELQQMLAASPLRGVAVFRHRDTHIGFARPISPSLH